jgi:hypothetical protein
MTSWAAQEDRNKAQADQETNAAWDGRRIAAEQLAPRGPLPKWPKLDPAAFHGLAGRVVAALEPHTEADPAGLLAGILVGFGAMVGRSPHLLVGADEHPPRLFAVQVGETSKARKGSAWSMDRAVLAALNPDFVRERVIGGFGSGEAVIDALIVGNDHRLLVRESEFARMLTVAGREGSILSMVIRDCWDGLRLENRTRNKKVVSANRPHVCVLADCTAEELRAKLSGVEIANGFANRFLFVCVRDSKRLPNGGNLDQQVVTELGLELRRRAESAFKRGILHRSPEAEAYWAPLYHAMCDDDPGGLIAAVIARDRAQMLRLQVTYALLDESSYIEPVHIEAAWAFWRYCRASAEHIWSRGDPVVQRLYAAIRAAGKEGLDGTAQSAVFGRNLPKEELERARDLLEEWDLIETNRIPGPRGRPSFVSRTVE